MRLFLDHPIKGGAYSSLHFPIFYYDGSVIATAVRADNYLWQSKASLFANYRQNNVINKKINYNEITLTPRQREVLFLLIIGLSQEQIATHLNISRGTISKCIATLCQKFGIAGQNTYMLMVLAAKLEYAYVVPKSLIKTDVVVL